MKKLLALISGLFLLSGLILGTSGCRSVDAPATNPTTTEPATKPATEQRTEPTSSQAEQRPDIYATRRPHVEYAQPLRRPKTAKRSHFLAVNPLEFRWETIREYQTYPQISGLIDKGVETKINYFLKQQAFEMIEYHERISPEPVKAPGYFASSILFNAHNILSVQYSINSYPTGMGQAVTIDEYNLFFNFDLNTGDQIRLQDLFVEGYDVEGAVRMALSDYRMAYEDILSNPAASEYFFLIEADMSAIYLSDSPLQRRSQESVMLHPTDHFAHIDLTVGEPVLVCDRAFFDPSRSIFENDYLYELLQERNPRDIANELPPIAGEHAGVAYHIWVMQTPIGERLSAWIKSNFDVHFASLLPTAEEAKGARVEIGITPRPFGKFWAFSVDIYWQGRTQSMNEVNKYRMLPVYFDEEGTEYSYREAIRLEGEALENALYEAMREYNAKQDPVEGLPSPSDEELREAAHVIAQETAFVYSSQGLSIMYSFPRPNHQDLYQYFDLPYRSLGYKNFKFFDDLSSELGLTNP
ncbi:MAG: hypothetical protein Q4A52_04070 [Bacillota bacterium]|nr:hypothetical protein [Bacillota bacterium]